jgi:hypothetical protein
MEITNKTNTKEIILVDTLHEEGGCKKWAEIDDEFVIISSFLKPYDKIPSRVYLSNKDINKLFKELMAIKKISNKTEGKTPKISNPNPTEDKKYEKTGKCFLCDNWYEEWGHNPEPLAEFQNRVCSDCNRDVVIPERIRRVTEKHGNRT